MKQDQRNKELERGLCRRGFLHGASIAAASLAMPRTLRAQGGPLPPHDPADPQPVPLRHTLIYINMRGGVDGLTLAAPVGDPDYAPQRPTIAVTGGTSLVPGTDYWYLPPALSPLLNAWNNGDLAILPASGLLDKNKSHFTQQDRLEFGVPPAPEPIPPAITSGFVARHLSNAGFTTEPILRGLVAQKLATSSFAEAPKSLAIANVEDFEFPGESLMAAATDAMHDLQNPPLSTASQNAFNAIDYLNQVDFNAPQGIYPNTKFGDQFKRAAALILDGDPPEVIEIDIASWDHHNQQGPNSPGGTMYNLMDELASALDAFYTDMNVPDPLVPGQTLRKRVTCLTESEFGRRVAENSSLGTDHGHGTCRFVLGGRVNGGIYDGGWTTLANETDSQGDVRVLTDHRDIWAEAFITLMQLGNPQDVYFGGFVHNPLGIFT